MNENSTTIAMKDDLNGWNNILLSIGSNLGNRQESINRAIDLIRVNEKITIESISSFYETEPVGVIDQDWFLNICALGKSRLSPGELIIFLKTVEYLAGRRHRKRWHEREIDIDILLIDDLVMKEEMLTIPHALMIKRRFVLVPAAEIAPGMVHPINGLTMSLLLEQCKDNSIVKPYF